MGGTLVNLGLKERKGCPLPVPGFRRLSSWEGEQERGCWEPWKGALEGPGLVLWDGELGREATRVQLRGAAKTPFSRGWPNPAWQSLRAERQAPRSPGHNPATRETCPQSCLPIPSSDGDENSVRKSSSLLPQVTSNLGKMILKEEMEKSLPIRRKTRSLPDRTPFHTCECHGRGPESPGQTSRPEAQSLSLSIVWGYRRQKRLSLAQGTHALLRARVPVVE